MFNINFANDWIQTADVWYWKRPLNQLCHNHSSTIFAVIKFTPYRVLSQISRT